MLGPQQYTAGSQSRISERAALPSRGHHPQTPNPRPQTLNPKSQTPNPKPQILNPKSQTHTHRSEVTMPKHKAPTTGSKSCTLDLDPYVLHPTPQSPTTENPQPMIPKTRCTSTSLTQQRTILCAVAQTSGERSAAQVRTKLSHSFLNPQH